VRVRVRAARMLLMIDLIDYRLMSIFPEPFPDFPDFVRYGGDFRAYCAPDAPSAARFLSSRCRACARAARAQRARVQQAAMRADFSAARNALSRCLPEEEEEEETD